MLVCVSSHSFCTRDRGCSVHPAFPAPSDHQGAKIQAQPGRIAPRDREGAFSLAPHLRGEGWGEGLYPRIRLAESPPHPDFSLCVKSDLSPQAGRGDPTRWRAMRIANEVPSRRLLAATRVEPGIDAALKARK